MLTKYRGCNRVICPHETSRSGVFDQWEPNASSQGSQDDQNDISAQGASTFVGCSPFPLSDIRSGATYTGQQQVATERPTRKPPRAPILLPKRVTASAVPRIMANLSISPDGQWRCLLGDCAYQGYTTTRRDNLLRHVYCEHCDPEKEKEGFPKSKINSPNHFDIKRHIEIMNSSQVQRLDCPFPECGCRGASGFDSEDGLNHHVPTCVFRPFY